ncbi:MAG: hypothetical protein JW751_22035 [Polyangiaceae bacterium]|nr:hypothetical protein [Polyangiaceae bacterium]
MKATNRSKQLLSVAIIGIWVWGCGGSGEGGVSSGGVTNQPAGSGGSDSGGSGGGPASSGGTEVSAATGGVTSGGGTPDSGGTGAIGGSSGTGGSSTPTGGRAVGGETSGGSPATGGSPTPTGGSTMGGATSGGSGTGGTETGGTIGEGCTTGPWAAADPSVAGPFAVATDNEVGPEAGDAEEDGSMPRFTMFRPEDLKQSGLCHPVITWGNGTGATPDMYGALLRHFASHGFVVIASNSTNVSRGDPKPMVAGVDWVLAQNDDPSSTLYQRIDPTNIGATGHSQGAMATSQASGDDHITTSVPIEGAMVQRNLHGPAMLFCGGQDDLVGCDGARSAFDAIDTLPAMYANYLTVDHGSWMSFGNQRSEVETAVTAWMRVHLMADAALRSWFYGASCTLCTDSAWDIDRKNMDQ